MTHPVVAGQLQFSSVTVSWTGQVKPLSHARLFVTPWTVVYQAPPSIGFSRQEYWSGLPFPSPGDLLSWKAELKAQFQSGYCLHVSMLSCFSWVPLFVTLWIVTYQAPLSMWFSRQEYWSRLPFPPSGYISDPCLLPLLHWQAGSLPLVPPGKPEKGKEGLNLFGKWIGG